MSGGLRPSKPPTLKLKDRLSPAWLLDCVMFDKKHNSLVISPHYLREHNIVAIDIPDNKFGSFTRVHIRIKENPRNGRK